MTKVLVKHAARDGRTRQAKGVIQDVKHRYLGGKISTNSGDLWDVKVVDHKDYKYVTVAKVDE